MLARSGGPSDQSQASGRARIGLSLQLLMPSDLNAGRVDLMLFTGPNMEGCYSVEGLQTCHNRKQSPAFFIFFVLYML